MTCRCGHQFCYKCGGDYPNCECRKQGFDIFGNMVGIENNGYRGEIPPVRGPRFVSFGPRRRGQRRRNE